jgi:hypothetical protein
VNGVGELSELDPPDINVFYQLKSIIIKKLSTVTSQPFVTFDAMRLSRRSGDPPGGLGYNAGLSA